MVAESIHVVTRRIVHIVAGRHIAHTEHNPGLGCTARIGRRDLVAAVGEVVVG